MPAPYLYWHCFLINQNRLFVYPRNKQAELIVKQAELQAERILDEARSESEAIGKEIRELKRHRRMLKVELRTVLESYLAMINEESPALGQLTNISKVA